MKTLCAAALAAAVAVAAVPAAAQDYRIAYGDLTLSDPAHVAQLDARIRRESRDACTGGTPIQRLDCRTRFRAEAVARLPAPDRRAYAAARGDAPVVMARAEASSGGL
jgi:UrcA family protein